MPGNVRSSPSRQGFFPTSSTLPSPPAPAEGPTSSTQPKSPLLAESPVVGFERDIFVWLVAFAGTVVLGVLQGVFLSVLLSVFMLLTSVVFPKVTQLGKMDTHGSLHDLQRIQSKGCEIKVFVGVVIFEFGATVLNFANFEFMRTGLEKQLEAERRRRGVAVVGGPPVVAPSERPKNSLMIPCPHFFDPVVNCVGWIYWMCSSQRRDHSEQGHVDVRSMLGTMIVSRFAILVLQNICAQQLSVVMIFSTILLKMISCPHFFETIVICVAWVCCISSSQRRDSEQGPRRC